MPEEKITEIVCISINLAKQMYGKTVYLVVSDNASVIIKIGILLKCTI